MTEAKKPSGMFDPSNFSEGLTSLAGVEGIVTSSLFKVTNWAKKDGSIPKVKNFKTGVEENAKPSTVWELLVKLDDVDEPVQVRLNASSIYLPSKDNVLVAKDQEGPFLVDPTGKKEAQLNGNSAGGFFLTNLSMASFDFAPFMTQGSRAIEGYRFAFEEKIRKDEKTGKEIGKAVPVVVRIIHGPGVQQSAKPASKPPVKQASAPAPAAPVESTEDFDPAAIASEVILEVLAETSPLAKAQVSVQVNKRLQARGLSNEQRLQALKAATSEEVLSSGPWNYDKKSLSAL